MKNSDYYFIGGAIWILAFTISIGYLTSQIPTIGIMSLIGIYISLDIIVGTIKTLINHLIKRSKGETVNE